MLFIRPSLMVIAAILYPEHPAIMHRPCNIILIEIYNLRMCCLMMLLQMKGKFTIGKMKSSHLTYNLDLNRSSSLISMYRSRYETKFR